MHVFIFVESFCHVSTQVLQESIFWLRVMMTFTSAVLISDRNTLSACVLMQNQTHLRVGSALPLQDAAVGTKDAEILDIFYSVS